MSPALDPSGSVEVPRLRDDVQASCTGAERSLAEAARMSRDALEVPKPSGRRHARDAAAKVARRTRGETGSRKRWRITMKSSSRLVFSRRTPLTDQQLLDLYDAALHEDQGVRREAFDAHQQMKEIPLSMSEIENPLPPQPVEMVPRRTPIDPTSFVRNSRSKAKDGTRKKTKETVDPALHNNPLRGRLVMALCSTAVLFMIFLQSLAANKIFYGSFHAPMDRNGMFGPEGLTLLNLGGLNANQIRNYGEVFRIFWAMWMHSGWIHVVMNLLSQLQYLFMFEPDWGFLKVFAIFWVSGVSGNLLSAVCNPCSTTVGSSGALFGLMGAMIPYCIEFWSSIPRPACMLWFSIIVAIASLLLGFTSNTDNWAHIGGLVGGLCMGCVTITTLDACRKCSTKVPPDTTGFANFSMAGGRRVIARRRVAKRSRLIRCLPVPKGWKNGRGEWALRIPMLLLLIVFWVTTVSLIFWQYEYQPLGHVTYSGVSQCCCCYSPYTGRPWECHLCSEGDGTSTWGEYCQLDFARSQKLKAEYAEVGLFEALGMPGMNLHPKPRYDEKAARSQTLSLPLGAVWPMTSMAATDRLTSTEPDPMEQSPLSIALPFGDLLAPFVGREAELMRLAQLNPVGEIPRNFSSYFISDLTQKEVEFLRQAEKTFAERVYFFRSVVDQLVMPRVVRAIGSSSIQSEPSLLEPRAPRGPAGW